MSVKNLVEDRDSELYVMSIISANTHYHKSLDLLKQVHDGLLQKWFSLTAHKESIEGYFTQVSDKQSADYYLKNFYSNVKGNFYDEEDKEGTKRNKYICFFVTPRPHWKDDGDAEYCRVCNDSKYIQCEVCDVNTFYCDVCGDVGYLECSSCVGDDPITHFLVGAVCWYSFQNPYTEQRDNAAYIDSILHFGTYEFLNTFGGEGEIDLELAEALTQNEVSEDINSAQVWTKLVQIPEIREIVNDKDYSLSYYGLINSYSELLGRIGNTMGIKMMVGF